MKLVCWRNHHNGTYSVIVKSSHTFIAFVSSSIAHLLCLCWLQTSLWTQHFLCVRNEPNYIWNSSVRGTTWQRSNNHPHQKTANEVWEDNVKWSIVSSSGHILCLRILSTFAHYFLHLHTQAQYSTVYSLQFDWITIFWEQESLTLTPPLLPADCQLRQNSEILQLP